jgi:hypothetical protein
LEESFGSVPTTEDRTSGKKKMAFSVGMRTGGDGAHPLKTASISSQEGAGATKQGKIGQTIQKFFSPPVWLFKSVSVQRHPVEV